MESSGRTSPLPIVLKNIPDAGPSASRYVTPWMKLTRTTADPRRRHEEGLGVHQAKEFAKPRQQAKHSRGREAASSFRERRGYNVRNDQAAKCAPDVTLVGSCDGFTPGAGMSTDDSDEIRRANARAKRAVQEADAAQATKATGQPRRLPPTRRQSCGKSDWLAKRLRPKPSPRRRRIRRSPSRVECASKPHAPAHSCRRRGTRSAEEH
jgi:hypothetical protein